MILRVPVPSNVAVTLVPGCGVAGKVAIFAPSFFSSSTTTLRTCSRPAVLPDPESMSTSRSSSRIDSSLSAAARSSTALPGAACSVGASTAAANPADTLRATARRLVERSKANGIEAPFVVELPDVPRAAVPSPALRRRARADSAVGHAGVQAGSRSSAPGSPPERSARPSRGPSALALMQNNAADAAVTARTDADREPVRSDRQASSFPPPRRQSR